MVRGNETESGKSQGIFKASMSGNPANTIRLPTMHTYSKTKALTRRSNFSHTTPLNTANNLQHSPLWTVRNRQISAYSSAGVNVDNSSGSPNIYFLSTPMNIMCTCSLWWIRLIYIFRHLFGVIIHCNIKSLFLNPNTSFWKQYRLWYVLWQFSKCWLFNGGISI